MAAPTSAGFLLHRMGDDGIEVMLVHPGGPVWATRDDGAWSIPKGEYAAGDDPAAAAEREFEEELGRRAPPGPRTDLGEVRQAGGKRVHAWAVRGDFDTASVISNPVEMQWPPRSGRWLQFPEVDRAAWFPLAEARRKLLAGQLPLLERLADAVGAGSSGDAECGGGGS